MRVPLSPRLKAIADEVDNKQVVADIGTDHGYLPVYLIKKRGLKKVIAADVNNDPLEKAQGIIRRHGLQHSVDLRLGDGLSILNEGEVGTVIIAGMGGVLISKLLKKEESIAKTTKILILQPIQGADELRRFLLAEGYSIVKEKLVQEKHRFYEIIFARFTNQRNPAKDPLTLEIGNFIQAQHPEIARQFLQRKIRIYEEKRRGMIKSSKVSGQTIQAEDELIKRLKEALLWITK